MAGAKLIKAFVPLSNMFGYTGDIRSMSQGRAASTMELAQYEEVLSDTVSFICSHISH